MAPHDTADSAKPGGLDDKPVERGGTASQATEQAAEQAAEQAELQAEQQPVQPGLHKGPQAWDRWDEEPVVPLTREQAARLSANNPSVSPWRVLGVQAVVGTAAALFAGLLSGQGGIFWSVLYGAATVVVPGALLARGMTSRVSSLSPVASAAGFMVWEMVKIGVSVALLMLAPKLVPHLNWLALLAGLVLCMKVYWVALLWRGR